MSFEDPAPRLYHMQTALAGSAWCAYRPGTIHQGDKLEKFTGKICKVVFDCFGDFNGFVLEDCCEHRAFESREREIGDLVLRALRERFTIMIIAVGKDHNIVRLVVKG